MSKKVLIGIGIVGVLIVVAVAAYVLRPTAEASAPIEAVPVEVEQSVAEEPTPMEEMTEMPEAEEKTEGENIPSTEEPAEEADSAASDGVVVFTIVQAESEVRFTLGELLSGVPTTVVGATDQVAGEIAIDSVAPANSKVGMILINARTFVTDNNFRNRAINNEILDTDEFEFVSFTPTAITGFPENPSVGEALEFQIIGDLTIRDITNEVTFEVTVTAVSETRLEGYASAMIARADYDLQVPNVPRVADVDEEVLIEINFVAVTK
jgi:polyisoprenoid-binding protein YceI